MNLRLRDVVESDFPAFFEHQRDPDAIRMLGYMPRDPNDWEVFSAHWKKNGASEDTLQKTILVDEVIVGNIVSYFIEGDLQVGYQLGKEFWGKGYASRALQEFLKIQLHRPIYAHASSTNIGSIRTLEKGGFKFIGTEGSESVFKLI
jgi:RimJ/RimL family protein N-acetyltransferase